MAIYLEGWQKLAYVDTCRVFRLKGFSTDKPTFELCYQGPCRFQERVGRAKARSGTMVSEPSFLVDLPFGLSFPAGSLIRRTTAGRDAWFATDGPVAQFPARGGRRSNTGRALLVPQVRVTFVDSNPPVASDYVNVVVGS